MEIGRQLEERFEASRRQMAKELEGEINQRRHFQIVRSCGNQADEGKFTGNASASGHEVTLVVELALTGY